MSTDERSQRFPALDQIGSRIAALRKQRGMTQSELSGDDVTRNMLSRIENGAALPSLPTLCAIAERLDVPIGALLGDPDDFARWQLSREMRRLITQKRYERVVEKLGSSELAKRDMELSRILCEAYIGCAEEQYMRGKLSSVSLYLDMAEEICDDDKSRRQIFILRTLCTACPALYPDDTAAPLDDVQDKLHGIVFYESDVAVYLYSLTKLGNLPKSAYSQPLPEAPTLKGELVPLISGISNKLYATHIDAKLDMVSAQYLDAKAKLLPLIPDAPPALLYDILADIEFCCKCCGDFENAYKYSGMRLELAKRIN